MFYLNQIQYYKWYFQINTSVVKHWGSSEFLTHNDVIKIDYEHILMKNMKSIKFLIYSTHSKTSQFMLWIFIGMLENLWTNFMFYGFRKL